MIPLVGYPKELEILKEMVDRVASEVMKSYKVRIKYQVGTMIELPRAAVVADEIAKQAEFFSFGTNDLTQTTLGLSRDDSGKFLPFYVEKGIFEVDPFVSLDQEGVGQLIRIGIQKGRSTRSNPMVGAVVVKDGRVIGTGYHKGPGTLHAEAVAIRDAGHEAKGSTLYINLE